MNMSPGSVVLLVLGGGKMVAPLSMGIDDEVVECEKSPPLSVDSLYFIYFPLWFLVICYFSDCALVTSDGQPQGEESRANGQAPDRIVTNGIQLLTAARRLFLFVLFHPFSLQSRLRWMRQSEIDDPVQWGWKLAPLHPVPSTRSVTPAVPWPDGTRTAVATGGGREAVPSRTG